MRFQNGNGAFRRGTQPGREGQKAGMGVLPPSTALKQALVQPEQLPKAPP